MSICKYCNHPIRWIEKKPHNNDGTSHDYSYCSPLRAARYAEYKAEKAAKSKFKRDKRKASELAYVASEVAQFNNRKALGVWYGGEVPYRIEEKELINAGIAKYNLKSVLQGSGLLLVAPDETILRHLDYFQGLSTQAERAEYNIAIIESMITPVASHVAKSVDSPRRWAIWTNGKEDGPFSSKGIAEASLADQNEAIRLRRELLGLPEVPVAA